MVEGGSDGVDAKADAAGGLKPLRPGVGRWVGAGGMGAEVGKNPGTWATGAGACDGAK